MYRVRVVIRVRVRIRERDKDRVGVRKEIGGGSGVHKRLRGPTSRARAPPALTGEGRPAFPPLPRGPGWGPASVGVPRPAGKNWQDPPPPRGWVGLSLMLTAARTDWTDQDFSALWAWEGGVAYQNVRPQGDVLHPPASQAP